MAYGYGFIPIGGIDGRPYNGATMRCSVAGADVTDIYPGDFVVQTGSASTDGGYITVSKAQGTEGTPGLIWGVCVSVVPSVATSLPYILGSVTTEQFINVAPLTPGMLLQCGASAAIAVTDVGGLCDFTNVAGAAPYYRSKSVLTASFGTSTAQLQLVGQVNNGKAFTATDADFIVRVTETQVGASAASVGV